jgi:hypothetical protein
MRNMVLGPPNDKLPGAIQAKGQNGPLPVTPTHKMAKKATKLVTDYGYQILQYSLTTYAS